MQKPEPSITTTETKAIPPHVAEYLSALSTAIVPAATAYNDLGGCW